MRRIHWYTAEKEKTNNTKVIKVKCIAFLISLIILSDLSTIQFRLTFKGHKSLEYCCLVIHLTSVSTISYAESNGGKAESEINWKENFPRKKEFRKHERIILSDLSFKSHESLE